MTPHPGAVETAECLPPKDATGFTPDRLEISTFASGAAVQQAYEAQRRQHRAPRDRGRCNGLSWGGEGTWLHNPAAPGAAPKPGGSRFCYFAGNNAVIVWTHRKFGQVDPHRHPRDRAGRRQRPPRALRLVAVLAPPYRQGRRVVEPALVAILDGAEGGREVEIGRSLTVGRGEDAGLFIDDPEISRAHAVLGPTGTGLEVEDLGSLNGTWVNGERISHSTRLAPGDVIKVGTTRIEVLTVAGGRPRVSAPAQKAPPTPVAAEDELRPVSALFADIVGSTSLAERLAPEDFTALIGGCVDRMCRAAEQFGGVIDAYMGDGIAAFFGFPAASEDDAERAARAALGIVRAISGYASEVRSTWNLDLGVRVGVNSGQVAIGVVGAAQRHPVALGDTMNVAARLQSSAEPGSILIGGATARKLRGRFLLAPLGHIAVRGRETPVEAWRLLHARPVVRGASHGRLSGAQPKPHGSPPRRRALRGGRGQIVLLEGEPGIGKTRLLEWFRDQMGGEVTWLEGQCASYGGQPPYFAFTEALRGWLADDVAARPSILASLGIEPNVLPYLANLLSEELGADTGWTDGAGEEFGAGVRRAYGGWLRGISRTGPVVLAVHDSTGPTTGPSSSPRACSSLVEGLPLVLVATDPDREITRRASASERSVERGVDVEPWARSLMQRPNNCCPISRRGSSRRTRCAR